MRSFGKLFQFLILVSLSMILLYPSVSLGFFESSKENPHKTAIQGALKDREIVLQPTINNLNTGFVYLEDKEIHFIKGVDKVFFQAGPVAATIDSVDFDDEGILVTLKNDSLGEGEIKFFMEEDLLVGIEQPGVERMISVALTSPDLTRAFINQDSGILHVGTCNHFPSNPVVVEKSELGHVLANGVKECGFCFKKNVYVPDYQTERKMAASAAANMRFYSPVSFDDDKQKKLDKVGRKVLAGWPIQQLGYNYEFKLLESPEVNAFALPGGQVFMTTGLFDSLESDMELEAVLAHEIAHVERRHSLKTIHEVRENQQKAAMIAAIGGAAAGVAASKGNSGLAVGTLGVTMATIAVMDVYTAGYSKEKEKEADTLALLYFEANGQARKDMEGMFKKLQFESLNAVHDPDPSGITHPLLSERRSKIWNMDIHRFNSDYQYRYSREGQVPVNVNLLYAENFEGDEKMTLYIDNQKFIEKINSLEVTEIKVSLVSGDAKRKFRFSRKGVTYDTFGMYVVLETEESEKDWEKFYNQNFDLQFEVVKGAFKEDNFGGMGTEVYKFSKI